MQGQYRKPEEWECPPLEATNRRMFKTMTEDKIVYITVISKV
jgi:hypothetical protein